MIASLPTLALLVFIKCFIVFNVLMGIVAYVTFGERKVLARLQRRIGPSIVGPFGLLQPIADGLKLFFKEEIIPARADRVLYLLAPIFTVDAALLAFCFVPWGTYTIEVMGHSLNIGSIADVNITLLFVIAATSLGVYGILFAGWASNSKYPLLGGLRAAAQVISYEITAGMAILSVVLCSGSLNLRGIVGAQENSTWFIFPQLIGFVIFLISSFAETNRTPFDLPEAESELVGGFHTEYSSMKFAMFFMGEYIHLIVNSSLIAILFLGGWNAPFSFPPFTWLPNLVWFLGKVFFFVFLSMWVRGTLPRVRFDQLMRLNWKYLLPLSFINLLITAFFVSVYQGSSPFLWMTVTQVIVIILYYTVYRRLVRA